MDVVEVAVLSVVTEAPSQHGHGCPSNPNAVCTDCGRRLWNLCMPSVRSINLCLWLSLAGARLVLRSSSQMLHVVPHRTNRLPAGTGFETTNQAVTITRAYRYSDCRLVDRNLVEQSTGTTVCRMPSFRLSIMSVKCPEHESTVHRADRWAYSLFLCIFARPSRDRFRAYCRSSTPTTLPSFPACKVTQLTVDENADPHETLLHEAAVRAPGTPSWQW